MAVLAETGALTRTAGLLTDTRLTALACAVSTLPSRAAVTVTAVPPAVFTAALDTLVTTGSSEF